MQHSQLYSSWLKYVLRAVGSGRAEWMAEAKVVQCSHTCEHTHILMTSTALALGAVNWQATWRRTLWGKRAYKIQV